MLEVACGEQEIVEGQRIELSSPFIDLSWGSCFKGT
jgi:hypothetical protein